MSDRPYRSRTAFWSGVLSALSVLLLGSAVRFAVADGASVLESARASDMGSLSGVFALLVMFGVLVLGVLAGIAGVVVGASAVREWRREKSSGLGYVPLIRSPAIMALAGAMAGLLAVFLLWASFAGVTRWQARVAMQVMGESSAEGQEVVALATGARVTLPKGWRAIVHEPDPTTGEQYVQFLQPDGGTAFSSWDKDFMLPTPETNYYVDVATGMDGIYPVESIDYRGWTGTAAGRPSSLADGTAVYEITTQLEDPSGNVVVICSGWPQLSSDGTTSASVLTQRLIDALNLEPPQ